jgi:ABC-type transport system involved in cytochrome c biogenesis permease subunit
MYPTPGDIITLERIMTAIPIASQYRRAFGLSLGLQLLTTLLLASNLDGGRIAKIAAAAMIGFWIGVVLVVLRRPSHPTNADLFYVRWGFPMILAVAIAGMAILGRTS